MTEPYPTVDYGRSSNRASVLIIGAGISGMTTAIEMIRKGYGRDFIIVEKGNQVGGTWSDNRYPGCCCVCPPFSVPLPLPISIFNLRVS
jgi:cation diffusion facilitator CzcD-associated flavoprotein CzcO